MKALPVDPDRLRGEFPALSEEDLEAYAVITRRVLRDPVAKGRAMREVLATARAAEEKQAGGAVLSAEESLALRYLRAVEKMQARSARSR